MDLLWDMFGETDADGACPLSKPAGGLVRTDHARKVEVPHLFRERAALLLVGFSQNDRPAGTLYRACAGRAQRPNAKHVRGIVHRTCNGCEDQAVSSFVGLKR